MASISKLTTLASLKFLKVKTFMEFLLAKLFNSFIHKNYMMGLHCMQDNIFCATF